jgi:hypothetical protein
MDACPLTGSVMSLKGVFAITVAWVTRSSKPGRNAAQTKDNIEADLKITL